MVGPRTLITFGSEFDSRSAHYTNQYVEYSPLLFTNKYLDAIKRHERLGPILYGINPLWEKRQRWVKEFSWAVPTDESILAIKNLVVEQGLDGVVEMGAGTGYWASCLAQVNVSCVCYDSFYWKVKPSHFHFKVEKGGPPKVAQYPNHALFLCWPPLSLHTKKMGRPNLMGSKSLQHYKGDWVIYVGEDEDGCTGDDEMWKILNEKYEQHSYAEVYNFDGIHDSLFIYRRKNAQDNAPRPSLT